MRWNTRWSLSWIVLLLLPACSGFGPRTAAEAVISVDEAGYTPETIEVVAGQSVRLTLQNTDSVEHHLGIRKIALMTQGRATDAHAGHDGASMVGSVDMANFALHIVAAAGASNTLEFTPTQPGQYDFECIALGHEEAGTLIVTRLR